MPIAGLAQALADELAQAVAVAPVGEHRLAGRLADDLAGLQGLFPGRQVVDGRVERPRRIGQAHIQIVSVEGPALLDVIASGAHRQDLGADLIARVG